MGAEPATGREPPMTSGDITFDPLTGNSVLTTDDGSIFTSNAAGQLLTVQTPHAPAEPGGPVTWTTTSYSAWDADKRPIAGTGPDGGFTLAYQGGDTVMTMNADHSVFTSNDQGQLLSATTAHHVAGQADTYSTTTYSTWDTDKRPTAGNGPDGSFTLGYDGANTVMTMDSDHSVFTTNGQGQLVSATTVQHVAGQADTYSTTTYSAWGTDKQPTAGSGPDGSFTLAYQGGNTIMTMDSDHSVFVTNPAGQLLSVTTVQHVAGQADTTSTTTYTAWDADKRPIAGTGTGPDSGFTLAYQGGNTIMTMDKDHSVFTTNPAGQLVSVTSVRHVPGQADTWSTITYTAWNADKQPTAGTGPDGSFTLAYLGADTIMTMDKDGTAFTMNGKGQVVSVATIHHETGQPDTVATTTYTAWDDQDRPIAGSDADGSFTITYDPATGYETITYVSGSSNMTTIVLTGDGKMVSTTLPDGTFIDWYVQLHDLGALSDSMARREIAISDAIAGIKAELTSVSEAWVAPAAASFEALSLQFNTAANNLGSLLAEAAKRMKTTYQNIVDAETINSTPTGLQQGTRPATVIPVSGSANNVANQSSTT
jgi:uncharacterized protein YukE